MRLLKNSGNINSEAPRGNLPAMLRTRLQRCSSFGQVALQAGPRGNLLRRSSPGYDLPSPTVAGFAKAGGREPQGFLAKKGE